MEMPGMRNRHEAAAKAALINYFRAKGSIDEQSVVISELELPTCARRADLVLIGADVTAVEIKTHVDSLARLPEQIGTFCRAFPSVYAAVATVHVQKAITLVPEGCGILELQSRANGLRVVLRKKAKRYTNLSIREQTSLLPAKALARAVRSAGKLIVKATRRQELVVAAQSISTTELAQFIEIYLRDKYETTSARFNEATSHRLVCADDLTLLRLWPSRPKAATALDPDQAFLQWLANRSGPEAFGPIPQDVATRWATESV